MTFYINSCSNLKSISIAVIENKTNGHFKPSEQPTTFSHPKKWFRSNEFSYHYAHGSCSRLHRWLNFVFPIDLNHANSWRYNTSSISMAMGVASHIPHCVYQHYITMVLRIVFSTFLFKLCFVCLAPKHSFHISHTKACTNARRVKIWNLYSSI